jgi:hypothetical protein
MHRLLIIAALLALLPACNLDEARGSGATKQHAQHDEDNDAWDNATGRHYYDEHPCERPGITVEQLVQLGCVTRGAP